MRAFRQEVIRAARNFRASLNEFGRSIAQSVRDNIARPVGQAIGQLRSAIASALRSIRDGLAFIFWAILAPMSMTVINILGYILDKIFLGNKKLREYTKGPLPNDTPDSIRLQVAANTGWDPYTRLGGVWDDIASMLGLGIGIFGFANLFISANISVIKHSHNILGKYSTLWTQQANQEKQPAIPFLRAFLLGVFMIPSVVTWGPIVLCTNGVDIGLSYWVFLCY
jgi:hypothetical protein